MNNKQINNKFSSIILEYVCLDEILEMKGFLCVRLGLDVLMLGIGLIARKGCFSQGRFSRNMRFLNSSLLIVVIIILTCILALLVESFSIILVLLLFAIKITFL